MIFINRKNILSTYRNYIMSLLYHTDCVVPFENLTNIFVDNTNDNYYHLLNVSVAYDCFVMLILS